MKIKNKRMPRLRRNNAQAEFATPPRAYSVVIVTPENSLFTPVTVTQPWRSIKIEISDGEYIELEWCQRTSSLHIRSGIGRFYITPECSNVIRVTTDQLQHEAATEDAI